MSIRSWFELLIRKTCTFFPSYYQPIEIRVAAREDRKVVLPVNRFRNPPETAAPARRKIYPDL